MMKTATQPFSKDYPLARHVAFVTAEVAEGKPSAYIASYDAATQQDVLIIARRALGGTNKGKIEVFVAAMLSHSVVGGEE